PGRTPRAKDTAGLPSRPASVASAHPGSGATAEPGRPEPASAAAVPAWRETRGPVDGARSPEAGSGAYDGESFPAFASVPRRAELPVAFSGGPAPTSVEPARRPSPPRLLKLGRMDFEGVAAALDLRIVDAPLTKRVVSVSVSDAMLAAAEAEAAVLRGEGAPASSDRVLGDDAPPPAPSYGWDHGWLAYWTAAAASRLVLARSL
ncbi:MAG: hypothetical protein HY553_07640, partial [Elusimicrobia bacterium]|nr:hypothetical protein [Elusimicrobiota bacterium]